MAVNLNSVFGNWVNEARYGIMDVTGNGVGFNGNITPESLQLLCPGCQSVGGLGYSIDFPGHNAVGAGR